MKSSLVVSFFVVAMVSSPPISAMPDVDRTEWPFYTPRDVEPPAVRHADRVRNGIDNFIVAALEAKGLAMAPAASREALLRRLYFDLIGLPPTPEEIDAFVGDSDPTAYEKFVDRLLDDPRHGERWARFWLDLARYADTAGYEGDPDMPHAWRYRDYVIDSLNRDKPYDIFIKEQIAGDEIEEIMGAAELPNVQPERLVALTFLRLAPFTEPRGDETRHELLSEMTSTVGSVFLGLTVGCAQCHDHKYDKIPTKDFYRMKAFFSTVQIPRPLPGDGFQIGGPLPAEFYRDGEKEWAEKTRGKLKTQIAEAQAAIAAIENGGKKPAKLTAGVAVQAHGGKFGNDYVFERTVVNDGGVHATIVTNDGAAWRFFTDGDGPRPTGGLSGSNRGHWFAGLAKPSFIGLGAYTRGTGKSADLSGFHRGHVAELIVYDHPLSDEERVAVDDYVAVRYRGEATAGAGAASALPRDGLRLWLDAADLDADPQTPNPEGGTRVDTWTDRVSSIRLEQDAENRQPVLDTLGKSNAPAVRFDDDWLRASSEGAPFLGDQRGSIVVVYSATGDHEGYGFEVGGGNVFVATAIYPGADAASMTSPLTPEQRIRRDELASRIGALGQHSKRLEPKAMSLRHSFGPPYEPGVPTTRVMIRGDWDKPGEAVEPGFPSCVTGHQKPAKIRLDPFKRWPTRSRRMTLAKWIASPENPLTARVMVNRLWHWHFGRGIVPNPSDFGKLGGGPSHPELLDWLARRFIEGKWSLKAVHRLIVTSGAYRQASSRRDELATKAATVDPENVLLWQFNRRRLEAEAVRDAVLSVSGRLNPDHYGLPIFPPLPGGIAEAVKWSKSKWATDRGAEGRKRSIYIYQQRTLTMPLMQAFDAVVCDQSRDRRRASVTPVQSLAMYNGAFVSGEAKFFAARIKRKCGDDTAAQLNSAFKTALGRDPDATEAATMRQLVAQGEGDGLAAVCRVLLNSNEFITID